MRRFADCLELVGCLGKPCVTFDQVLMQVKVVEEVYEWYSLTKS